MGSQPQGSDRATLERHFGVSDGLLPLWIAEPDGSVAGPIVDALAARAAEGWYGYEVRPDSAIAAFWDWMAERHAWAGSGLHTLVSPSVGTSIGVLIEQCTEPGDGVLLQPPVFTDFKPLVTAASRSPVRNPLRFDGGRYSMDFADLEAKASDPANRLLILCSPHNPVGRVWSAAELSRVASICAEHDVVVVADEIHADLVLGHHRFVPFAQVATGTGVAWAATHGPIKTFGLAGVCDTLLVTDDETVAERFRARSSQLHLTRNNVFGLAAFEAAYRAGGPWLDALVDLVESNLWLLRSDLPDGIDLVDPEGTYLAWLDLRALGLEVSDIPTWLGRAAGLALSPGHWFGREGAGFARMTVAASTETMAHAITRLRRAVQASR